MHVSHRRSFADRALVLVVLVLGATSACSITSGTLGGREKCWPESDPRGASLWRGVLRIDATGGQLATPEGDVIRLLPGTLATRVGDGAVGELVHGANVVARAGDEVTLFGGMGSDGALVVCGIEEVHPAS